MPAMETPTYTEIEARLSAEAATRPAADQAELAREARRARYHVAATYRLVDAASIIADLLEDPTLPYTRTKAEAFITSLQPPA